MRITFHRSTGPSTPYSSTVLMARSMATQAMTLEWVKWRRGPRTSQMPSSGSRQPVSRNSISARCSSQAGPPSGSSRLGRLVEGRHDLAVDVELELPGRGVADPHRARSLVARQPVDLPLVEPPLAPGPVHDLHLGRVAGRRPQQPAPPGHGLLVEAAAHQRLEGQGGVAQPAEPVVPVATAAQRLGQRGGGGGHDPPGGLVGEGLQGDQRPHHRVAVLAVVRALGDPLLPPLLGVGDGVHGVDRARRRLRAPDTTRGRTGRSGPRTR